jgi:CheY-like chemotaxis protein
MTNESTPATEPLCVLVIEHVPDISFLLRRSLEGTGHHVTTCPYAEVALEFLDLSSFDLISLDYFPPGMHWRDFLRFLNQEVIKTPVIVASACPDERLIAQALRDGVLDYVVKEGSLNFLVEYPERVRRAVMQFRSREPGA